MRIPDYIPKSHLFNDDDLPLFESASSFAFCQVFKKQGMDKMIGTFDVVVRDMPTNRNFMIFGGLEEIIVSILNWNFREHHIKVLRENNIIGDEFASYLKSFKFSGSISAMKEGTVFFPGEPIIRITAPIVEANLFYIFLLNAVVSHTVFMSKTIRSVIAAKDKIILTNAGRAQGFEAGTKFVRAAYLVGATPALQLSPVLKWGISLPQKFVKSSFHAFIKAFPTELAAMSAFAEQFPDREATLMVDTYNFEQGVKNAIKVCEQLKKKGGGLASIFIDSGDLHERAVWTRKQLDDAGFTDVKILLASNLNEWRMQELLEKKTPCDFFMAITELATSSDDPKLEIVYKMAEINDGKSIRQTMKMSSRKKSLPGCKQVYRQEKHGKIIKDIIGLEKENIEGRKLLTPMVQDGQLIYQLPRLDEIKDYIKIEVEKLPDKYKRLKVQEPTYKVEISSALNKIVKDFEKKSKLVNKA